MQSVTVFKTRPLTWWTRSGTQRSEGPSRGHKCPIPFCLCENLKRSRYSDRNGTGPRPGPPVPAPEPGSVPELEPILEPEPEPEPGLSVSMLDDVTMGHFTWTSLNHIQFMVCKRPGWNSAIKNPCMCMQYIISHLSWSLATSVVWRLIRWAVLEIFEMDRERLLNIVKYMNTLYNFKSALGYWTQCVFIDFVWN